MGNLFAIYIIFKPLPPFCIVTILLGRLPSPKPPQAYRDVCMHDRFSLFNENESFCRCQFKDYI